MSGSKKPLVNRPGPTTHDNCFRWWVYSFSRPDEKYLVQLDAYNFNGVCQCESFRFKLEKILKQGIGPEEAVARKLVKLKAGRQLSSALQCDHILEAFMRFAVEMGKAVKDAQAKQANRQTHAAA